MWAVFKKELKTYFLSPSIYVMFGIMFTIFSIYFISQALSLGIIDFGLLYYIIAEWGLFIMIPILTMRLFVRERKNGTDKLLFTSTKSTMSIILGKFFAAVVVTSIFLLISTIYFIITNSLSNANITTLIIRLIGFLLIYMAAISVGMLASSIAKNKIIAFIITIILFLVPYALAELTGHFLMFDITTMYTKFPNAIVSITDIVSIIAYTTMCLLITNIILQKKRNKKKTYVAIISIGIIIAIYVGIYIGINIINPDEIDLTKDRLYSITETSKNIIQNIDQDIEIILVHVKEYNKSVADFIYKYSKENDKIKIKEISNIEEDQELKEKYNLTTSTVMIIVKNGEKERIIAYDDLNTTDYTTYEQKSILEETMTNALIDVTEKEKSKIYYITGHNKQETNYISFFLEYLKNKANDVEELNITEADAIPKDADTLILTTLQEDFKEKEKQMIIDYIHKGGNIIVFTNPNVQQTVMPMYEEILDEYGVSISEGIMLEQDTNKIYQNIPNYIIEEINKENDIFNNITMNLNACFMTSGKLEIQDEETLKKLNVTMQPIAQTSETSYYRNNLFVTSGEKQPNEKEGSEIVAALLTKQINDNTTSKLIIYANNMFMQNVEVTDYAFQLYNNKEIALKSVAYLIGKTDDIIIRKNTETTPYRATIEQNSNIIRIICVLPGLMLIAGIIIKNIQKRKKN